MMKNIFAGYGKIAAGDLYIHRKALENELCNRTINYETFGSVSVVGMQRMGKSSLVYNTIITRTGECFKKGIIIVSISMDNFDNPERFFKGIVDAVYDKLDDYDDIEPRIERRYRKVAEASLEDGCVKSIQSFFKLLFENGKRVLCVIDEFDHSRKLFADFGEGFNILRDLAYQPETNVTFIFVSRRMVSELESSAGISTLSGILGTPVFVKGYNDEELQEYYNRSEKNGVFLSDEEKEQVFYITGAHPYWMDILMYHYVESRQQKEGFESLFNKNSGYLYSEYERLMTLLKEQSLLEKLYQIIFGPAVDYTKADVRILDNYGIISLMNDRASLYSNKLLDYMRMREETYNYSSLWNKTERRMRGLLKYKLKEKFGDKWEEEIEKHYIRPDCHIMSLGWYLDSARELKKKAVTQKDLYIQDAPYTIIEALTTAGLFTFFETNYDMFQDVLGPDKKYFVKISNHLTKARNPYQHSNGDLIEPAFKSLTKGYCELINKKIDMFEENEKVVV